MDAMRPLALLLLLLPGCFTTAPPVDDVVAEEDSSSDGGESEDGEESSSSEGSSSDGEAPGWDQCPGRLGCPCADAGAAWEGSEECGPPEGGVNLLICLGEANADDERAAYLACSRSCDHDQDCIDSAPWGATPTAGATPAICDSEIRMCVVPCTDASECASGMTCQRRGDRDGVPLNVCVTG
jgi:hypothetical protein